MKPPDVQLVALTFADGSVGILSFITTEYGRDHKPRWIRDATDEAIIAEIQRSSFPWPGKTPVQSFRRITANDIPADRTFRDAWVDTGAAIQHDMPKVRAIHLARLRRERDDALLEYDKEWMRASGQKDTTEADRIETLRQALRDLPETIAPTLEAATTPEDVKMIGLPAKG